MVNNVARDSASQRAGDWGPAAGTASAAGRLEGVSKRYGRRRDGAEVLHGVSAVFPLGTLTAVMGLSGSGKSTLLHLASGLDRPNAGRSGSAVRRSPA